MVILAPVSFKKELPSPLTQLYLTRSDCSRGGSWLCFLAPLTIECWRPMVRLPCSTYHRVLETNGQTSGRGVWEDFLSLDSKVLLFCIQNVYRAFKKNDPGKLVTISQFNCSFCQLFTLRNPSKTHEAMWSCYNLHILKQMKRLSKTILCIMSISSKLGTVAQQVSRNFKMSSLFLWEKY